LLRIPPSHFDTLGPSTGSGSSTSSGPSALRQAQGVPQAQDLRPVRYGS
jgi:hypothetical protein